MEDTKVKTRSAIEADLDPIKRLVSIAFSGDENKAIINLVDELSKEVTHPPIKSLIAERNDKIVGYGAFSPVFLNTDIGITGYILSPLAVSPEFQKQGVGTHLIKAGREMLAQEGVDVLLVYGDPRYYERFGFRKELAALFEPPYTLKYPFGWLGLDLNKAQMPTHLIRFNCVAALSKPDMW